MKERKTLGFIDWMDRHPVWTVTIWSLLMILLGALLGAHGVG